MSESKIDPIGFLSALAHRAATRPNFCVCCEDGVAVAVLGDLPICWGCWEIIDERESPPHQWHPIESSYLFSPFKPPPSLTRPDLPKFQEHQL